MEPRLLVFLGGEDEPAYRAHGQERDDQRRKDPPDAAGIELGEAEGSLTEAAEDDRRDEEAGDDEKDVDADEPRFRQARKRMERHHGQHRDPAQAVDIGPVFGATGFLFHMRREYSKK